MMLSQETITELLSHRGWTVTNSARELGGSRVMSIRGQFTNGMVMSLQASSFHYCEPRATAHRYESIEVEIFTKDGEWYTDSPWHTGDQVLGWVDYEQLYAIIIHVETQP